MTDNNIYSCFAGYAYGLAGGSFACALAAASMDGFLAAHDWTAALLGIGIPGGAISGLLLAHLPRESYHAGIWIMVVLGFILPAFAIASFFYGINVSLGLGFTGGFVLLCQLFTTCNSHRDRHED